MRLKIYAMGKGKLILICQFGGDFVTSADGTISYSGGEANAVNINHETLFDDLKLKLAEMCNLEYKTVSIKYFLPGNRRNLITLRNDKDLTRMLSFHGNSVTADVFVMGREGFDRNAFRIQANRESASKSAETLTRVVAPITAVSPVASMTPAQHVAIDRTTACADTKLSVIPVFTASDSVVAVEVTALSPSRATTSSIPSSDHSAADDSDYAPFSAVAAPLSLAEIDMSCSPADTVKKRRRTASWKIGAAGPIIVTMADDTGERRSSKKNSRSNRSIVVADGTEQEGDLVNVEINFDSPTTFSICDDDSLEKLVASWKDGITGVGQEFKSVKEFRDALQKYAIAHRFVYKLKKNDTNRASGRCIVEGCSWRIHASWVQATQSFQIKRLNNSHTCGGESWKSAHPAKNWLVSVIKERLRDSPHQKPREIAKSIFRDFGIKLNYTQVWRGIEDAREQLQGSYKDGYNQLPRFCERLLKTNPGSCAKLVTNDDKRFQRLFVSFHASIHGFQNGCRPLLFLEAMSLKSKYQEILLTATALDGNDAFFPVAFAIADVENDDSWHWFLEQLKSALSTSQCITFVSDREQELKKIVLKVFENAHHGFSMYHLMESFKRTLKGPFQGDGRATLPGNFLGAAHAVRLGAFKNFTEQIKQVSPHAYDWAMQIEQEDWTSLSFKGERHNYIIRDAGESYSKLVEEVRESTIIQKVEALESMIKKLITVRRVDSSKWSAKLTPSIEEKIQEETLKARGLKVLFSTDTLVEVQGDCNHVVDLNNQDCTCLMWKETGLPCCHAIAVFNCTGRSVYDYCSKHFMAERYRSTYSESINSVPDIGKPVEKEEADSDTGRVLPPNIPRSPGQPKKERAKIFDPDKRTVACSKCKELGHNKASCKATV